MSLNLPHPEVRGKAEPRRAHRRAIQLARAALTIEAAGQGVSFSALKAAHFTFAEIAVHAPAAERMLRGAA